jgi:hypothetical protein
MTGWMVIHKATEASRPQHPFSINVCVCISGDKFQGLALLSTRLMGAVYHCLLVNNLTAALETHATSSKAPHVVHAFSPHSQTALQRHFRWTVNRTRGPVNRSARTLALLLWIFAAGTHRSLVFSAAINELRVLQ